MWQKLSEAETLKVTCSNSYKGGEKSYVGTKLKINDVNLK